jgi:hypothetical protein
MLQRRKRMSASFNAVILPEPLLIFGGSFPSPDPKAGLALFGPYALGTNRIRIGIVGDTKTVNQSSFLLREMMHPISGSTDYPRWTPDFPGMSLTGPLKCEFVIPDSLKRIISHEEVLRLEKMENVSERVGYAVSLFSTNVGNLKELEEPPHIVICAPPRRMMDLCIPPEGSNNERRGRKSSAERKIVSAQRKLHPSQSLLADFLPDLKTTEDELLQSLASSNFHNFLKARVMALSTPIQMIRPYTLDSLYEGIGRKTQEKATIAWNLATALLYKTEARPWILKDTPISTCFVGISFYREGLHRSGRMGTSLAQVFAPDGDGLVLRGERFDWPSRESPHLSTDAARRLLSKALSAYEQHTGRKPDRVVVHKSSRHSAEEIEGFRVALEGIRHCDLLSITTGAKGIRFFRSGLNPVLRGTAIALPGNAWLLYTKAYSPFLQVYPGPRVPRPLEITQDFGDMPMERLNSEILGLTKLNWNSADHSCLLPITLEFSRQIGTILREIPAGSIVQTKYRYYM